MNFLLTDVPLLSMEIFYVLTKYVQSRLLQNCRMRERVKNGLSGVFTAEDIELSYQINGLNLAIFDSSIIKAFHITNLNYLPNNKSAADNFWKKYGISSSVEAKLF